MRGSGSRARSQERLDAGRVEIEIVQAVDRGAVDRDRHEQPVHARQHAVLVRNPLRERAQVLDDVPGVGVEDVRTVLMIAQPVRV